MAKILVADAVPEDARYLAEELGALGYDVVTADGGLDALATAVQHRPDAIVLDVALPDLSGLDVLRRMKADPDLAAMPVVLLSARGADVNVLSGLDNGAHDYVEKPVHPTVLAARLRSALRIKERQDAVEVLHARLAHSNEALRLATNVAESASQAKGSFLASMSHELRTPMNPILGFTHLLLKSPSTPLSAEDVDALETVERNAHHLLHLINSLLDFSKIEAGEMTLERAPFSLSDAIREVVQQHAPQAEKRHLQLRVALPEAGLIVVADAAKVRQIVANLVANAVKYTEAGTVTVAVSEDEDPKLGPVARIVVRDTGSGFPPEDYARLFERFVRLDSPVTRRVGGTGLGLPLSAEYARLHGGRIDVVSEVGAGSEFTFVLPLSEPALALLTPEGAHQVH